MKTIPMKDNAINHVAASTPDAAFLDQLRKASLDQREEILVHYLKHEIGKTLHLKVEEIPVEQYLMYLGLDSLVFLRLMEVVARDLKIKIEPHEAFETFQQFTIQNLARRLARNIISTKRIETTDIVDVLGGPIVPDPEHRYLPFDLTDIQHAYWIGRSGILAWGNVPCHAYAEFDREDDGLNFDRLNRALQRVIERHDMLRAIVLADGKQQILRQVPPYEIEVLDIRGEAPDVVESRLNAIRQYMIVQELQSDHWPLFEIRATRFHDNHVRFHVNLDLLIFDGQSIQIMFRDLAWFYNNPDGLLDPLELSFRDYIDSLAVVKGTDLYKKSQAYWIDRLSTLPMPPELPMVKDITLSDFNFVSHTFELNLETWNRLKSRAAQSGLTPSCLLLTAYTTVLATWNKSPHFTLNLTQYSRHPLHSEVTEILGDFTSVLLVSVDNSGHDSFEMRARRVQEEIWKGMEYRYFNGVEVMREMTKRQNGNPYIVPYVFTSITGVGAKIGEEEQEELEEALMGKNVFMASRTPQVVLDHQVSERDGGLFCRWEVVEGLFPDGLIGDMFETYRTYLKSLADEDEAWQETTHRLIPVYQIEKRAEINATETLKSSELLHTLFANKVLRQPDHPAVISHNRSLSYGELSSRAHQVGHLLREKGAKPNALVAIVMEKGWEQVVAALGVLYSGAAYLPIDTEFPEKRVLHFLENGEVSLVLTQSWLEKKFEWPENIECFCVDKFEANDGGNHPLEPKQKPEDLAYVIYTSGSTGLPKGVMIDHRGAVNTILDVNKRFDVGPEDRVLALSNLNFDLSVYDIFGTLAGGGTIVLPEADKRKDPACWSEVMTREQVTVWNSVPALMQMLVEYASGRTEVVPKSLRLVLLSGDWIPLGLLDQIKTLTKRVQVIGLGGATEASIWSTLYPIEEVDPEWKSIPYGSPMVNQRLYVLNESMEACPDWVPGQLYIGGIGLAKGYWRDEEKTRNSFITHPVTGERLYRTGDLGRYLPDGNIEFLGREDFQVKIRGYRIELGEIEAALVQCSGVREAAVVAIGEPRGDKRLVGYVVLEGGGSDDSSELRRFMEQRLPEYMVPSNLIRLDSIPLTSNGKADKASLIARAEEVSVEPQQAFIAPRNLPEETIAGIWADLLQRDRVGIHDNFFELGGNSLLAMRMYTRLQESFEKEISVVTIFEHPTVSSLAQYVGLDIRQAPVERKSIDRGSKRRKMAMQKQRQNLKDRKRI